MDSEHRITNLELRNEGREDENAGTQASVIANNSVLLKPEIAHKCIEDACSTSSSSSALSEEDFFQIEEELGKSNARHDEIPIRNNLQPPLLAGTSTRAETGTDITSEHRAKNAGGLDESVTVEPVWSGNHFHPFAGSSSPGSDNFGTAGTKQSPIQLMERSDDVPDPNRIPSSIFARTKTGTVMEWSVASNESVFSIHMGKSVDLTSFYNSAQLDGYPPFSTQFSASPAKDVVSGPSPQPTAELEQENTESMKNVVKSSAEEHDTSHTTSKEETIPHSDSISHCSDGGSVNSYRSFAFPTLSPEARNGSSKREPARPQSKMEQPQESPPLADTTKAEDEQVEPPKVEPAGRSWFRWPTCSFSCPFLCLR